MSPTSKEERLEGLEEIMKTKDEKIMEIEERLKIEEKNRKLIANEVQRLKIATNADPVSSEA